MTTQPVLAAAPDPVVAAFMGGAAAAAWLVVALFFLRFWARTHDRLFLAFALASGLMAANQTVSVTLRVRHGEESSAYLLRLLAFLLILLAVLGKNLGGRRR